MPIRDFLKQEIRRQGYKKGEFAKEIGMSSSNLYKIFRGETPISRPNAARISEKLGHSHDFWLRSQVMVGGSENVVPFREVAGVAATPGEGNAPQLLTDVMLRGAVSDGTVSITNYRAQNQKAASYDLTLASSVRFLHPTKKGAVDLQEGEIELDHLETIAFETVEEISLSKNFFGRVGATAELARVGIGINRGLQIDPNYSGPLRGSLVNFSGRPFRLFPGQVVMSIEVYYLPIAGETLYPTQDSGVQLLADLRARVAKNLHPTLMDDGRYLVSWEDAQFEIIEDGPKAAAVDKAMDVLRHKLTGVEGQTPMSKCVSKVASGFTPTRAQLDAAMALPEIEDMLEENECEDAVLPPFAEGQETLRAILEQAEIPVCAFVLTAMAVASGDV